MALKFFKHYGTYKHQVPWETPATSAEIQKSFSCGLDTIHWRRAAECRLPVPAFHSDQFSGASMEESRAAAENLGPFCLTLKLCVTGYFRLSVRYHLGFQSIVYTVQDRVKLLHLVHIKWVYYLTPDPHPKKPPLKLALFFNSLSRTETRVLTQ